MEQKYYWCVWQFGHGAIHAEAKDKHPFYYQRELNHIAIKTDTSISLINFIEISKEEYNLWNQQ